jgi:hypothetical protein
MVALLDAIVTSRMPAFVPAGVVAQAWRGGSAQHAVGRLLKAAAVRIDPLDETTAYRVGLKLAESHTSDVIDAHVALLAARVGGRVFTSDPDDIGRLDPRLPLQQV